MISSGIQHIIQLLSILVLLNIVIATYEVPNRNRQLFASNTQRSADSGYKYAWFTRDIHDDMNNDEENRSQEQPLSLRRMFREKTLKNLFNRKYQNNDDTSSESNEKL
jgi:hypothetical protein